PWNAFFGVLAVVAVPMVASFALYPGTVPAPAGAARPRRGPTLLRLTVRLAPVWIAAAFLGVYVGLESGIGNWGFSFLTETRGADVIVAGWIVSGYWLGLTIGRFVLNALADRIGVGVVALTAGCIGGIAAATLVAWLVP